MTVIRINSRENTIRVQRTNRTITLKRTGPRGIPGPSGDGDKTYTQSFTNSSSVTVTHKLGKYPAVTVINSAKDEVVGNVEYLDPNSLVVSFSASFSGSVLCN